MPKIELYRSRSLSEPLCSSSKVSPIKLARSRSLLDVRTPTRCSLELPLPLAMSSDSSILANEVRDDQSEHKSNTQTGSFSISENAHALTGAKHKKGTRKSNQVSTQKKAMVHLAAVSGAVTIGAVLAPFTCGMSLLPTVFAVMYGNASAIAMYGGSQFEVGENEKKKDDSEHVESDIKTDSPARSSFLLPQAKLPHSNDDVDADTGDTIGRGDIFNNCFNTVNNVHNRWYVFINAPSGPVDNLVPEEDVGSNGNNMATQTNPGASIACLTEAFADETQVTVSEIPSHAHQERVNHLIRETNEPRLLNLCNEDNANSAKMVEITGKDGATAFAILPSSMPYKNEGEGTDLLDDSVNYKTTAQPAFAGWEVKIPRPVSLTQGAQTGSNYTQGPRRNLSSDLDPVLGSAGLDSLTFPKRKALAAASKDSDIGSGVKVSPSVDREEAKITIEPRHQLTPVAKKVPADSRSVPTERKALAAAIGDKVSPSVEREEKITIETRHKLTPVAKKVPADSPTVPTELNAHQESATQPSLNLDKIKFNILGKAGEYIQYMVPKFLDRPEAGTYRGAWRPIPEALRGTKDSPEFVAWRKKDLDQYMKSLNTKVLLTQGASSMYGHNHLAGKSKNIQDLTEINKLGLKPLNRMKKADYQQFAGFDSVHRESSSLLKTSSGETLLTAKVMQSNKLVSLND